MKRLINFDPLTDKLFEIYDKVDRIERLLDGHPNFQNELKDDIIDIEGASDVTKLAKQTIYQLVSKRKIPYMKGKGTKRLYFSRIELREWILQGRKKVV